MKCTSIMVTHAGRENTMQLGDRCDQEATHGAHCWTHAQRKREEQRAHVFPVPVLGWVR